MNSFLEWATTLPVAALVVAFLYIVTLIQLPILLRLFLRQRRAIYRKVAIIGPPRAGKTTLITAMLDRVLNASDLPRIQFQERAGIGEYASNIRALQRGSALPETASDRFFVYKFDYSSPIALSGFSRTLARALAPSRSLNESVHVELVDFAGDYTQALANMAASELSEPALASDATVATLTVGDAFLDWVRTADAILFLVDGKLIAENNDAALGELISDYKAIWLHIGRTHADAAVKDNMQLAIAITKVDLIHGFRHVAGELSSLGAKERVDAEAILEISDLTPAQDRLLRDLHSFLKKNGAKSPRSSPRLLLTSAIGPSDSERLGISNALGVCLK